MQRRGYMDDDLMQAVATGDEGAFDILVVRHRNWVYRLLHAFTHNPDQAEDLVQEVFCRVHVQAVHYTAQGQFVAWLKRIAVNMGKDYLTQQQRAAFVPLSEVQEMPDSNARTDPLASLMTQLVHDEVRDAILTLPDDQRLAVVMRFFGAMSVQEIAWAMKCPEGTIKSRLFHGLRRIRERVISRSDGEREPQ